MMLCQVAESNFKNLKIYFCDFIFIFILFMFTIPKKDGTFRKSLLLLKFNVGCIFLKRK